MTVRTIFATLMVLSLAAAVQATPSTLIWIPSTDIQAGSVHLGIDAFLAEGGADDPATDFGLTFGDGKIEYGLDYFEGTDDPIYFNAKALLKDESPASPRLVAGVYGLGTDSDTSYSILYLLASKTFEVGRLTAGYGIGRKEALGNDNAMVMLGWDRAVSDKWWAAIDYQGGGSAFGALSAGVAYTFSPTTSLTVGYDWFNDSSLADCVTIQLDMNL